MPRTALTPVVPLGSYPATPITATAADLAMAAGDNVNGNKVTMGDKTLVIVQNTAGAPGTVTFTSVADDKKRKGDITAYSVAASAISVFGPFLRDHWMQSDGTLSIDCSAATMKFAVLQL